MINYKNTTENLLIVIFGVLVGGAVAYFAATQANKQTILALRPVIEEAIRKETTSITNTFKTEIKKLKARKGAAVNVSVDPVLDNEANTSIKKDSLSKKRGFFSRIFKKETP